MEHSSRTPEQRKSGLVKGQVVTPRLAEHEATIERGRRAFYETGLALAAIRDGKLYKPSYHSFDAYCRQRWELSRSHADRLIVAAQRVRQLGELAPMGVIWVSS